MKMTDNLRRPRVNCSKVRNSEIENVCLCKICVSGPQRRLFLLHDALFIILPARSLPQCHAAPAHTARAGPARDLDLVTLGKVDAVYASARGSLRLFTLCSALLYSACFDIFFPFVEHDADTLLTHSFKSLCSMCEKELEKTFRSLNFVKLAPQEPSTTLQKVNLCRVSASFCMLHGILEAINIVTCNTKAFFLYNL